MAQLGELEKLLDEGARQETQILAVSPDAKADSLELIDRLDEKFGGKPGFPLLSDADHKVIDRYGLLNPKGKGYPHPAVYVINLLGEVVWRFVETDYKIRAANADIVKALSEAN